MNSPLGPSALLDAGLRGALVAALMMLALQWALRLRQPPRPAVVWLALAFSLGLAVQTLAAAPWVEYRWTCGTQAPWVGVSLGNSVLFWLFARALFDDGFRPRIWHAGLWVMVVALGASLCMRIGRTDPKNCSYPGAASAGSGVGRPI